MEYFEAWEEEIPVIKEMAQAKEVVWINPDKTTYEKSKKDCVLGPEDVEDAEKRLLRFAPLIEAYFPETRKHHGLIESPLVEITAMKNWINQNYESGLQGTLLLKEDSHLAIAGSVKARGGIYEVLKYTEALALEQGWISQDDDYKKLGEPEKRKLLQKYTIQVGSTGNLGLSIGIISAVLGYHVVVHMSADARQWKKDLLRSYGVDVKEYEGDYGEAVKQGRALSDQNPKSYFVDDENSRNLFLGYAVAGKRLKKQLDDRNITINQDHPLFVYLPCGVGGAPGGISFGLKQIWKDHVHCFFAEPVQAPCMLLGMTTGLHNQISVQDIGLTGNTRADGLAVGRPSGFVGGMMKQMLSGEFTIEDEALYRYMKGLWQTENIFLEPSACAAFQGPVMIEKNPEMNRYLKENQLDSRMKDAVHIVWATGGSLVPEEERKKYLKNPC